MYFSTKGNSADQRVDPEKASLDISKDNLNLKGKIATATKNEQSQCHLCQKNFSTKFNLNRHLRNSHLSGFTTKRSKSQAQTTHIPSQTSNRKFICNICHEMFLDKLSFSNHYLLHKIAQPIKGDNVNTQNQCIIVYVDETKNPDSTSAPYLHPVTVELPVHTEHSVNGEEEMSKESSTITKNHDSTAVNKRLQCQFCHKSYCNKFGLTRHQQNVHKVKKQHSPPSNNYKYACYICDETFPDKASLRHHFVDHKTPQPHRVSTEVGIDNEVIVDNEEVSTTDNEVIVDYEEGSTTDNEVIVDYEEVSTTDNKVVNGNEEGSIDNEWTIAENSCSAEESISSHQSLPFKNPVTNIDGFKESINFKDKEINIFSTECIPADQFADPENALSDGNTSKNKLFQCEICLRHFTKKYNLYRHTRKKHITSKRAILANKNRFPAQTSNRKFICDICDEMFLDKPSLQNHHLVHRNTTLISAVCSNTQNVQDQCIIMCVDESIPNAQSSPQEFLLTRYSVPTKLKPYLCHICKESFEEKDDLKGHLAAHEAGRMEKLREKFICESCKEEFKDRKCLDQHLLEHEVQNSFICYPCKKTFETECSLKKHQSLHTNKENKIQLWCRVCNRIFDQKDDLKQHLLTHSDTNATEFMCRICNEPLEDKSSLICHLAVHDAGRNDNSNSKMVCILCRKGFTDRQLFQEHLFEHTNQKRIPCDICDKVFLSKQSFEKHMSLHKDNTAKSKFFCEICDKTFDKSHNLSQHLLTHSVTNFASTTTEKVHFCHICNDSFDAEIDLQIHLEVHEIKGTNRNLKNEMFTCKTCNKEIKGYKNLRLHLLQHTNKKIFMCRVRNTSFVNQSAIKKHMVIHKNKQKKICDLGKKGFKQKHDLNQHMLVHKDKKTFVCEFCSKGFELKFKLKKHLQKCQASRKAEVIEKNQIPLKLPDEVQKIFVTIPVRNRPKYSIYSQLNHFPSSLKYH